LIALTRIQCPASIEELEYRDGYVGKVVTIGELDLFVILEFSIIWHTDE